MKVKKNLSIEKDIIERGQKRANELFGGNFSIYITHLINKDTGKK